MFKIKFHSLFSKFGLILFFIVSILSLIPVADDSINWVTLYLKQGDNYVYRNVEYNLKVLYSFKHIEYMIDNNSSSSSNSNDIYLNIKDSINNNEIIKSYKFPIICNYSQDWNINNYNICSETNLNEAVSVLDKILLLNSTITVLSIAFILIELIIEFKILKQLEFKQKKRYKLFAISFRLLFIIPTILSIISLSYYISKFPSTVSNKFIEFPNHIISSSSSYPWKHDNGLIIIFFTMFISIIASISLLLSFYCCFKKLNRNLYHIINKHNSVHYSLLYV